MLRSKDPITPGNPLRAVAWASVETNLDGVTKKSEDVKKIAKEDMGKNNVQMKKKLFSF